MHNRLVSVAPVLLLLLGTCSCAGDEGPKDDSECTQPSECGDMETVCDGCPERAVQSICADGTCEARDDDAVDVVATVLIHRDIDVGSIVHVVASMDTGTGRLKCADAISDGVISEEINVLATGYKGNLGGDLHPDLSIGRVPTGEVAVLVLGTADAGSEGEVVGAGCVADLDASGAQLTVDLVNLDPLD